jgi:hypothetical protein
MGRLEVNDLLVAVGQVEIPDHGARRPSQPQGLGVVLRRLVGHVGVDVVGPEEEGVFPEGVEEAEGVVGHRLSVAFGAAFGAGPLT